MVGTVNLPEDSRLPGGGGGTLSFYDLLPGSVRPTDELRTNADNFGGESQRWHGFDFTLDARVENLLLQGGVSTGRVSTFGRNDAAPLEYCQRDENWLTQVKLLGSYTLPYDIQVAGTLQNQPGPQRVAVARFTETSLGRASTLYPSGVQLNIIPPGSLYGDRFNQFDIRFTKILNVGGGARLRAMFDIFNVFNANTVTLENPSFAGPGDPNWLAPQVIMPGRLAKFAFQLDF